MVSRQRVGLAAAALLACCLCAAAQSDSIVGLSGWQKGLATEYGGAQDLVSLNTPYGGVLDGSCGYGQLDKGAWPYWAAGGLSLSNPLAQGTSPQAGCGKCLEVICADPVHCPNGPTTTPAVVLITDSCSDCAQNQINVQFNVFNTHVASWIYGNVTIQYRQVECAPPSGISVLVRKFRAELGGYIGLALLGVAGSGEISTVEIRATPQSGSDQSSYEQSWQQMSNTYGAMWERSGIPPPPLDLRITNWAGQQIVAGSAITKASTGTYPTSAQFTTSSTSATTPASSPPSSPPPSSVQQFSLPTSSPPPSTHAHSPSGPPPPTRSSSASSPPPPTRASSASSPPPPPPPPPPLPSPAPASARSSPSTQSAQSSTTSAPSSPCPATLADLLQGNANATTFLTLCKQAGVDNILNDPNVAVTALVPTNDAFRYLAPGLLDTSDITQLQPTLLYHFLSGRRLSSSFAQGGTQATTVNGETINVGPDSQHPGQLMFQGKKSAAYTFQKDLTTCHAAADIINAVLLP